MELKDLGWNDFFIAQWNEFEQEKLVPGRISLQQKKSYQVISAQGLYTAIVAGKLRHEAKSITDFPVIGDWVLFSKNENDEEKAVIHHVLMRQSKISRDKSTRKGKNRSIEEQVIVANVDTVFLVTSFDEDLNINRLERYLTMIWEGGSTPVVLVNKADVCDDVDSILAELDDALIGANTHAISALQRNGLESIQKYLLPGKTIGLIGSSGVGKSTLINTLIGEELLKVGDIGDYKDKGKHTTTHREMILLENGTILIDNPGMRAVQLMDAQDGLGYLFEIIEEYAKQCRFSDCQHENEPDCAVKKAIESGEITRERYENYLKLQKETAYQVRRVDKEQQANVKKRWKSITKTMRRMKNDE